MPNIGGIVQGFAPAATGSLIPATTTTSTLGSSTKVYLDSWVQNHYTNSNGLYSFGVGFPILRNDGGNGNGVRFVGSAGAADMEWIRFGNTTNVSVGLYFGSGSPEGAITAAPGSLYLNRAGGSSTTLYAKGSGTGNTGWLAVTTA